MHILKKSYLFFVFSFSFLFFSAAITCKLKNEAKLPQNLTPGGPDRANWDRDQLTETS